MKNFSVDEIKNFRMGFHGPGHNSQHHLHMHLVLPPFLGEGDFKKFNDEVRYGSRLISIEEVCRKSNELIKECQAKL